MSIETDDTNYADIENIDSVEGIIKIGISGAPSISDLSPNSDWRSFPPSSYNCCYGLPYQDHNYGAPPPPTPPPSPGSNALVTKNKSFEIALKSLKPNKSVPERRVKAPVKRQAVRRRNGGNNSKATVVKPVADESEPVVVTNNAEQQENGEVLATGDYSDSITRCICSFTHDDGYMICCDQCQVWQHIDCMGIDRANIPEEYCCEQCMPRKVHKARARLIQKKKRDDILRSSSEDENTTNHQQPASLLKVVAKHRNIKKVVTPVKRSSGTVAGNKKKAAINTIVNSKRQGRRNVTDSILLSVDGDTDESPLNVPYESATANQYSTDIEESLKSYKPNGNNQMASILEELAQPKCQLRLLVNGHRGLEVEHLVTADQPLIEFKGKVMLQQQFEQENSFLKRPMPFVLFYKNWEHLQVCVDATSFGNEARFVRRSCTPNSEVRHVIERGQVHLLLFAVQEIAGGFEVTIPFDFDFKSCEYEVECACVRPQCPVRKVNRKVKKQNSHERGQVDNIQNGRADAAAIKQTPVKRAVHEKLKLEIAPAGGDEVQATGTKVQSSEKVTPTETLKSPSNEKTGVEEARRLSREDRKIEAYMKAFEKMEKREEKRKELLQKITEKKESPDAPQKPAEPVKKETKQQVQPTAPKLRNQANKTTTQVKTTTQQQPKSTPKVPAARRKRNRSGPVLRRRTTSNTASSAPTSDGELDENSNRTSPDVNSRIPAPAEVGSTATGTLSSSQTSFRFPKTKKHLLNEWYHERGLDKCSIEKPLTVSVSQSDSIDFVKTNSSPGSSWAHLRRNSVTSNGQSTNVTQSNGTPVLASRKLDISMGSAKKRWLKQAMEEDSSNQTTPTPLMSPCSEQASVSPPSIHASNAVSSSALSSATNVTPTAANTALSPNGTALSMSSHLSDFVTPLKKRRVARESLSLDSWPTSLDHLTATDGVQVKQSPLTPPPSDDTIKHAFSVVKEEPSTEQDSLLNNHQSQPLPANIKLEAIPETGNDVLTARNNSLLWKSATGEEMVPATVHTFSPDMALPVCTNEIPTTVGDMGEERTTSPLKKYKLAQSKEDNGGSGTAVMLSPREPRTLLDLMQLTTASNDSAAETELASASVSPTKELPSPKPTQETALMSKQLSPRKSLLGNNMYSSTGSDLSSSLSGLSTAARALQLGQQLRRTVSMMEDVRHHSSIWNGPDFGGKRVHDTGNQAPCGTSDFAPVTPPSKKKVSLLEYRKRMQVQPPKSDSSTSVSAPTTPLISNDKVASKLQAAPITLPALPLFLDGQDGVAANNVRKPLLSLDERLKLEFGFAAGAAIPEGDSNIGERHTPSPPPPPPPVRPTVITNSPHTSTTLAISQTLGAADDGLDNNCCSTNEKDERVTSNAAMTLETNGYTSSIAVGPLDNTSASPQASPTQHPNGPLDSPGTVASKKPNMPLKQGSLGAVMLGQSVSSPLPNRDISGSRQITQSDLPKKYR